MESDKTIVTIIDSLASVDYNKIIITNRTFATNRRNFDENEKGRASSSYKK